MSKENLESYLKSTPVVDWESLPVLTQARELAKSGSGDAAITKAAFEWVRDEVKHSYDHSLNPLTCSASQVLKHRTGYCFAKSHLLAALLRANGIPAGFCYQRVNGENKGIDFYLHGYCAVYLENVGWYRIDPRGNKPGVDAQFTPPVEKLAYRVGREGEWDDPRVWPEPLEMVVQALNRHQTWDGFLANLPDLETKPI
jgi:transglutaminase-like putative cysteine protease